MNFMRLLNHWLQKFAKIRVVSLPVVAAADLELAKADDWEYLRVVLDAYQQKVQPELLANALDSFGDASCTLILYNDLCGQVNNGGFIQFIQNGYGPNLFNSPFVEDLAGWGATELAELVQQARGIYHAHQQYLERRRSIPEFSQLYKEFKQFEPLEEKFYEVEAGQTALVRAYVEQHLDQFARVE